MKQFWWYTKDRYLCNEYMHNMYFGDIADPDLNPKCLMLHDQHLHFAQPQNGHTPQQIVISKKSTERFKILLHGVTGPYGDVCLQSTSGGSKIDQGGLCPRLRRWSPETTLQQRKLEPGNGQNYEKEGKLCEAYGSMVPWRYIEFADDGSNSSMCLGINFMLLLHNWVGMFVASERTDQDVNDQEEFVRYLNQVALPVQKPVLERWGFEVQMDHTVGDDAKLKRQAQATTRALYGELYNAVRGKTDREPQP
ncbi:hypothetical protein AK812_SmicGene22899 [Symbiodinium microadriaticum]|uniref:Uncharacterized protein n=1 Tax=Symbiodinium microadriaticum TaxID=2951 RepID=A0A1Q9DIK8_SYMMI|nr:hypothetical protein AK812_SmicGene22899 [Symbiodinium microadriaticum]